MSLTMLAVLSGWALSGFVAAGVIVGSSTGVSRLSSSANSQEHASSKSFANIASAATTGEVVKRQHELEATRLVNVNYKCDVAGLREREFEWEAYWTEESGNIEIIGNKHIDKIEPIRVVTNNFATSFSHGYILQMGTYCCLHTFDIKISGTLYDNSIDMSIDRTRGSTKNIHIKEFCTARCGDTGARIHSSNCVVLGFVYRHV